MKRFFYLLLAVLALTAWIAWLASEPDPYLERFEEDFEHPYPWLYPAWMFVVGLITAGLLGLSRPAWSFFGTVAAFGLTAASFIALLLSIMHSHPVHEALLLVMLCASGALLFVAGYRFAFWRKVEDETPLDD